MSVRFYGVDMDDADSGQADLIFVIFGFLTSIVLSGSWRARRGLQSAKEHLSWTPGGGARI